VPAYDERPLWQRHWEELRAQLLKFSEGGTEILAGNSTREDPDANNKEDRSGQDLGKKEILEALEAISRTLKDEGAANRGEELREDTSNKLLQIATLLFVILTTGGIFWRGAIFNRQLDEMRSASIQTNKLVDANASLVDSASKQANAAQKEADALSESVRVAHDNVILAERAWLGPNNAGFASEPAPNKAIEVTINYQNSGRQPALNFLYFADPFSATVEDDINGTVVSRIAQYLDNCKSQIAWPGGSVVYPSTGFSNYVLNTKTKEDFVDDPIIKKDKIVFLQGCFLYRTFDAPRHSYFCFFYKQGQTKFQNLNICANGHYAD
jgi:hypothetical protein